MKRKFYVDEILLYIVTGLASVQAVLSVLKNNSVINVDWKFVLIPCWLMFPIMIYVVVKIIVEAVDDFYSDRDQQEI